MGWHPGHIEERAEIECLFGRMDYFRDVFRRFDELARAVSRSFISSPSASRCIRLSTQPSLNNSSGSNSELAGAT